MMAELMRRAGELASLASCLLNVLLGTGDREVTLSAGSFELLRRGSVRGPLLVAVIDFLNKPFDGPDHCQRAWNDHAPIWAKVRAE